MTTKPEACTACKAHAWDGYQAEAEGTVEGGILLVGEALGAQEALEGRPFRGAAGFMLVQLLQRGGLAREEIVIDNLVRCRPPQNVLRGSPDEVAIIDTCTRLHLQQTVARLKPKVIVALGTLPARHVLGLDEEWDPETITQLRGYPAWSARYQCWVVPTYHPAFLLRGQTKLCGVVLADICLAQRMAREGYVPRPIEAHQVLLDPTPEEFERWVAAVEAAVARGEPVELAYDIETPYKTAQSDSAEETLFEDPTWMILRVGFSWGRGEKTCTIPWDQAHLPHVQRLMGLACDKVVWNAAYDNPRLAHNGVVIRGRVLDAMEGWHLLNSALPKKLQFVAPFYVPEQPRWKHLSANEPALYNAIDAQLEWEVAQGLWADLRAQGNWELFLRHMVELRVVLDEMESTGVPVDVEERARASRDLDAQMRAVTDALHAVIPREVRPLKIYKRPVEDKGAGEWTTLPGHREENQCARCGAWGVSKSHGERRTLKLDGVKVENACYGAVVAKAMRRVEHDALVLPFVPSNKMLGDYLRHQGQKPVFSEEKRVTFDDEALEILIKRYPGDRVYPLVREYRDLEKILSTYLGRQEGEHWVGGMPVSAAGRIHTHYTNNPSTLRLSSVNPNLQNVPRGDDEQSPAALVKRIFVAEPGTVMAEVDYRAIEAVLVGYLAGDPLYMRMSRLGIHDFINSHILSAAKVIPHPADPRWNDEDLRHFFGDLKKRYPRERTAAKRVCHSSNYGATPNRLMQVDRASFPSLKVARDLQALYFAVFPSIRRWQEQTVLSAAKHGYLRTPFGNLHRFWRPVEYRRAGSQWVTEWGEEAKAALAFVPQSTAAGIMKEALLRLSGDEELREALRLTIHDSVLFMLSERRWEAALARAQALMEAPMRALPLEVTWGLGNFLGIETEAKVGERWSELRSPPLWQPARRPSASLAS